MKINIKSAIVPDSQAWIYEYFGIPCACPKAINKSIAEASKTGEKIDVYINSPGGETSAGAEIYEALREYGNVAIHVIYACSAASVIMCAGYCDITPVGLVMIHNARTCADGDNRDLSHVSDVLKTIDRTIAAAYTAKTGKTEAEFLEYMAAETWLTAEDAVKLGLCDAISQPKKTATTIPAMVACETSLLPQTVIDSMQEKRMVAISELNLLKLKTKEI